MVPTEVLPAQKAALMLQHRSSDPGFLYTDGGGDHVVLVQESRERGGNHFEGVDWTCAGNAAPRDCKFR